MNDQKQAQGLQKSLNPMSVWAIAFGCIIGWGSFINPGKKFLPNSGVAGTAIAMVLGALVMVIIAFSYAYMVPKYPKAGGEFTFTKNCFGKIPAYLCGWFLVAAYLTNVPMNSTAIGLIVDGIDGGADILKFGFHYQIAGFEVYFGEILLAMGILILFGVMNILGVKKAGFIQTVLAVTLAVCAFTLCISGLISAKAQGINMEPVWGFDKSAAMAAGATTENIDEYFVDEYDPTLAGIDPERADLYRLCEQKGVALTVMKGYAGGRLLDKGRSPFGVALTPVQCLHYALTRPAVASVLIGFDNPAQIPAAMAYETATDGEKDYATVLANAPKHAYKGQCTYCGHCKPCPMDIDIAMVNKLYDLATMQEEVPASVREHYADLSAHASDCIGCGACEERCPFEVPVVERMQKTAELFEM